MRGEVIVRQCNAELICLCMWPLVHIRHAEKQRIVLVCRQQSPLKKLDEWQTSSRLRTTHLSNLL